MVFSLLVVAVGQAVTFTEDTSIASDNYTYDGSDVIVDSCGLTINGGHDFSSIQIINGGYITHAPEAGLVLHVTGDMVIESSAWIYLDGKGYGSDSGPGAGAWGNHHGGGAGHGGGGGYGGTGGAGGGIYGSMVKPSTLGSGGGTGKSIGSPSGVGGGRGGGVIKVIVNGTLTLNGTLSANGKQGGHSQICIPGGCDYWSGGGGSGGSVWIDAKTLAGNGRITADGGNGGFSNRAGGGGGGRIAIEYDDASGFDFSNLSVQGGTGREDGEPGTGA